MRSVTLVASGSTPASMALAHRRLFHTVRRCAWCAAISSTVCAASSNSPAPPITSPAKLLPTWNSSRRSPSTLPTFGARRLIREFDLPQPPRPGAHLARPRPAPSPPQKVSRKQDLAHIKATWRLFQQISADTRTSTISPTTGPRPDLRLPVIDKGRCAAACSSSPLPRPFCCRQRPVRRPDPAHLSRGFAPRSGLADRHGGEFIGSYDRQGRRTGFPAALGDSQHVRIPPAAHTFQSDVETVHRLVEDEFFVWIVLRPRRLPRQSSHLQLYFTSSAPSTIPLSRRALPPILSRSSWLVVRSVNGERSRRS